MPGSGGACVLALASMVASGVIVRPSSGEPINRREVVRRHNPVLTESHPVQVGNGEFAFTADITGLQTFEPCCTMSQWGWHSAPLPPGLTEADFLWTPKDTYCGRVIEIPAGRGDEISRWLYANPHRLNLGRIALRMILPDGSEVGPSDIANAQQTLDLWTGVLTSRFEAAGEPVRVTTCCHPDRDLVAVRVESPLVASGRLAVEVAFPYPDLKEFGGYGDWTRSDAHETTLTPLANNEARLSRRIDADRYSVCVAWSANAELAAAAPHTYRVEPAGGASLECAVAFSPAADDRRLPTFRETRSASARGWGAFWTSGGAIDLSGSTDPRWQELERRIVLSQYLTAVNCAGSLPPQESGLVNNGWNGKFHMEMYWWHGAHYALWDRWPLLERSLGFYVSILESARATAARQGYEGARWPKCVTADGRESPHPIHAMLIWQQPHPIFFAELDYRAHPTAATLEKWREVVTATADFMASFAERETGGERYILAPPIFTVPEITDPDTVLNPTFELVYWRYALELAQGWRERLRLERDPDWDRVLDGLATPAVADGVYLMEESLPDSYTPQWTHNHPSVVGAFGVLPGTGLDSETMRRTVRKVDDCWQWDRAWGWDFPMMALACARTGDSGHAIDWLLHPNYQFDVTGYPNGGPLPYLPSSGGLLYAVAAMAAGWDGAPDRPAPGFPGDGSWNVRYEGLVQAP